MCFQDNNMYLFCLQDNNIYLCVFKIITCIFCVFKIITCIFSVFKIITCIFYVFMIITSIFYVFKIITCIFCVLKREFCKSWGSEVIFAGIMAPLHPLPRPDFVHRLLLLCFNSQGSQQFRIPSNEIWIVPLWLIFSLDSR